MTASSMLRYLVLFLFPFLVLAGTDQEGVDFLAENAKKPDVVTLPSGLQYKILNKGSGQHHPASNSPCLCHYEGRLLSGKVFDSSYDRGQPTTFAPNQVIKGWTEAMQLMVEGDKFELYIPSELGYGDSGAGADIPGGAVLVFQMEILEIQGEKVPALTCNPSKPDENCSEKEQKYVEKMKQKTKQEIQTQIERLNGMLGDKMTPDLIDWMKRRIHILKQMTKDEADAKEL
jgi:FKBP-type peptidyl-prolyl cis-trans isomerase FklB